MNQDNNFVPSDPNVATPNTGVTVGVQPGVTNVAGTGQVAPTVTTQVAVQPQAVVNQPSVVNNIDTSTNPNIIICSKCGSEMRKDARYCMKCGNLNYAHPDNESMKQYAWQNIKQGNFISGAIVDNRTLANSKINTLSNASPFRVCLITNIILHLLMGVGLFFLFNSLVSLGGSEMSVAMIIAIVVSVALEFVFNYSFQAMYIKAGEPWWGYYIPFYSNYILFKIALGNGWIFLTLLIPGVGSIISLIALYHLGRKFYKNGWLTLLFPFVMIPIIGLDKNSEYSLLARASSLDNNQVDSKGKTQSEKKYGRKKLFITIIIVVIVAVILYFTWPYILPLLEKFYNFFMEQLEFFK